MIEYKCDCCGKTIEYKQKRYNVTVESNRRIVTEFGTVDSFYDELLICPRCFHKMKLFMQIQRRQGKRKAKK
jgi:hypothetical protein